MSWYWMCPSWIVHTSCTTFHLVNLSLEVGHCMQVSKQQTKCNWLEFEDRQKLRVWRQTEKSCFWAISSSLIACGAAVTGASSFPVLQCLGAGCTHVQCCVFEVEQQGGYWQVEGPRKPQEMDQVNLFPAGTVWYRVASPVYYATGWALFDWPQPSVV